MNSNILCPCNIVLVNFLANNYLMKPQHLILQSLPFQEAVSLVQTITDAEVASRELIKEAYTRGSSDNITCVVVRFDPS